MRSDELARQVMILYRDVDESVERYRAWSGLACVEGCGTCCETSHVEASVLEMLPLAAELWRRQEATAVLNAIEDAPHCVRCILYRPEEDHPGFGRCNAYEHRPLLCRLFGFSGRLDRRGFPELIGCRRARLQSGGPLHVPDGGAPLPIMRCFTMRLYGIDPALSRLMPINDALHAALSHVGARLAIRGEEHRGL